MKTKEKKRMTKDLLTPLRLARLRFAEAELQMASAQAQARLAKRRRKEAKQAARRAKKQAKLAKREFAEAKLALAETEGKLARAGKQTIGRKVGKRQTANVVTKPAAGKTVRTIAASSSASSAFPLLASSKPPTPRSAAKRRTFARKPPIVVPPATKKPSSTAMRPGDEMVIEIEQGVTPTVKPVEAQPPGGQSLGSAASASNPSNAIGEQL